MPILKSALTSRASFLAAASLLGLAWALPASAQFRSPEDAVEYRQSAFTVMGTHFGRIGAMVQGKAPYDAAVAAQNAEVVAFVSKLPYAGFVEGTSDTKKGSAKANIWTDRAKFDAAAKKLQDESAKLAVAAKGNSMDTLKPAFAAVAETCKACHDEYRNK